MHKILTIIFLMILINSCSEKNEGFINCDEIEVLNKSLENQIKKLKLRLVTQDVLFISGPVFHSKEFVPELDSAILRIEKKLISNNSVGINSEISNLERLLDKFLINHDSIKININECEQFSVFQLLNLQNQILTSLPLFIDGSRYYFNKTEVVPIGEKDIVNQGEVMRVSVIDFAYDSTIIPRNIYWIDDTSYNEINKLIYDGFTIPIATDSLKKGKHVVYGFKELKEDGVLKMRPWELEFTIN